MEGLIGVNQWRNGLFRFSLGAGSQQLKAAIYAACSNVSAAGSGFGFGVLVLVFVLPVTCPLFLRVLRG